MSALVLAGWLALSAVQAPPAPSGESYELFRGLEKSGCIHIRVPSGPCEDAAARLAAKVRGAFEVTLDPDPAAPGAVRFLVGAPTDPELLPCASAVGVEPLVGGFRVLGREFTRPGDALVAVIEDPAQAGLPLCFVLGNDLELVAAYLDEIPRLSRPHLWVHADGELALECPLAPDGTPRAEEARDYLALRAKYFEDDHTNDAAHLLVHARKSLDRERWRAYGLTLTRVGRRVSDWFGSKDPPDVEMFVYEHLADFEECLGTSALYVANRLRPRLHVLLQPGMPDDGGAGLARLLGRSLAGDAAAEWLEDGLGVAAAGTWWQRPLDTWATQLAKAKLLPAVGELLAPDASERFSEHVLVPARALFFRQSVQDADPRRVRALWKGAQAGEQRNAAVYASAVRALTKDAAPAGGGRTKAPDAKSPDTKAPGAKAPGAKAPKAKPGAKQPAGKAPGAKQPGAKQPGAKQPGAKQPGAKQPGERPPGAKQPAVKAPGERPAGARQRAAKPPGEKPPRAKAPGPREPAGDREAAQTPQSAREPQAHDRPEVRRDKPVPFRRGLCLVQDERVGYSAHAVDAAVTEAQALGSGPNALSLTVFATTEDPLAPVCPARLRSVHASAGDLALANSVAAAHAAKLDVLLSLEVLARPSGAWADVISWTGADDQELFWERYGRITDHYALLAELLGLELFSLGSNLRESARTEGKGSEVNPQLFAQRRERWDALIARVRAVYDGTLVFTARSPGEAEESGFLEAVDSIGLFLYPRGLREESAPEDAELRRALRYEVQQALDLAVRWNKPLIFVQVGFPARAESWSRPTVPRGALDLGAQQRYFEALADVLSQKLQNASILRGWFLWNWPLDASRAGADDAGFSLRGKPVDSVLGRLFER